MDTFSVGWGQPRCTGVGAASVAGVFAFVGPVGGQGALEAFGLSVGPGVVRSDEEMPIAPGEDIEPNCEGGHALLRQARAEHGIIHPD